MVSNSLNPRVTAMNVVSTLLWVLSVMLAVTVYKFTKDMSISETLILVMYILLFRFVVLGLPAYAIWKFIKSRQD